MAILDWPTGKAWRPTRMTFGASTPKSAWSGFFTGQSQSISHFGDRLRVELTLPPCSYADAGVREAFLMQLASAGDWVRLWHMQRPQPQGDMRGSPTLNSDAAAGARSILVLGAQNLGNLLTATQAFQSATEWVPTTGMTVSANVAARPGSTNIAADQLTDGTTLSTALVAQAITVPDDTSSYTASIHVKQTSGGTAPTFALGVELSGGTTLSNNPRLNTDLGTVLIGTATVTSTDGYWRISAPITNNGTGNTTLTVRLYPSIAAYGLHVADPTVMGNAVVWGAQVNPGATATGYQGFPDLDGGDIIGCGGQLLPVAYTGAQQGNSITMTVPLALPLRQAISAGTPVVWDQPTGNFQLLSGDLSQVEYLPGRYQGAVTLSFVEAY